MNKDLPALIVGLLLIGLAAFIIAVWFSNGNDHVDTVTGIEQHTNPQGDRFIMVRADHFAYGLWVTDACASALSIGDNWPSKAGACK